ncbi:lef-5, partial [Venturia canescens]
IFFSPDGRRILLSTALVDLPAPILLPRSKFPVQRTVYKYRVQTCEHEYEFCELTQLRRGDETPASLYTCKKCCGIKIS